MGGSPCEIAAPENKPHLCRQTRSLSRSLAGRERRGTARGGEETLASLGASPAKPECLQIELGTSRPCRLTVGGGAELRGNGYSGGRPGLRTPLLSRLASKEPPAPPAAGGGTEQLPLCPVPTTQSRHRSRLPAHLQRSQSCVCFSRGPAPSQPSDTVWPLFIVPLGPQMSLTLQ